MQRSGDEDVVGCSTPNWKFGKNMCYAPLPGTELVFVGDDGDENKSSGRGTVPGFPLGKCEGDCDSDWDCEVCIQAIFVLFNK